MASEESKNLLKSMVGKTVGKATTGSTVSVTKKLPKKIRQIPDCYFLPRRSLPSTIAIYSAVCAAGVGAGMLLEVWIKKKIKEDGGIIWQMDKKSKVSDVRFICFATWDFTICYVSTPCNPSSLLQSIVLV